MAELVLEGVHKSYGDNAVVKGVDLRVGDGEIVCLLGGSGCGKTTTLRMVAGLEAPSAGRITIGGVVVSEGSAVLPPEARRLGMVFQSYAVWPHLTVLQNVLFPLEMAGVRGGEERARAALVGVRLGGLEGRYPNALSGGQQQRVALARALVAEPRLLLLDEPLSNLDAKLRAEVRDEIRELVKRLGVTAILVTHDHEEAFAVADRIALMDGGRIVQDAPPQVLHDTPAVDVAARFLGVEELPGEREGDTAIVDGVRIPIHATADAPPRGPISVGFRVGSAQIAATGIEGKVVSRTYVGLGWRCRVRVGEREVKVSGDASVGASVRVQVARAIALAPRGSN